MGKKFMVVRPTYCCGSSKWVGRVFESEGVDRRLSECANCGTLEVGEVVIFDTKHCIQESRIVWLPDLDEDEELQTIKELEKETT